MGTVIWIILIVALLAFAVWAFSRSRGRRA